MPKPGRLRFLLILTLHGQLLEAWKPAELTFPPGLSRLPREDALCLVSRTSPVKGLYWFSTYPEEYWPLSLSLSSSFLYTIFWETDQLQDRGLLPFDLPPSTTNSHPDPVAQASSDGTLGHHRLSSFQGSQGTLRPKGPLGRYLGDAPPSFRVSLLFAQSKYQVTTFSLDWTVTSHLLWGQANPSHRTLPWPV